MRIPILISLLAVAAASFTSAQAQKVQEVGKLKEAGSMLADPVSSLKIPVTGLTKENLALVKSSLAEIMVQTHVCEACKFEQPKAGTCPKCTTALKATKLPLLGTVTPAADNLSLVVNFDKRRSTKISEIEATLARNSVHVNSLTLPIVGSAFLVLQGGKAEMVPAVEKMLIESKLFSEVHAAWEPSSNQIFVMVRAGTTVTTRGDVLKAIEPLHLQIADVIFGTR